ncbi:DUF2848 domain-containing protein [Stappia taiwanensis]|uniref:DUF2848 domain-containing protein n=1 Tax=Stappia taiwanensis TaxID=992267 RepID=A0A838XZP0_9HYPH|nr:DUF2848 domain-containing protein [Stappia taiwanensis]MBA4612474.1 DUF2848 domain-containing protein [Stappia taiwanensis]GGF05642.1 hypothetical protein GCM10007285_36890 [Stappia taiwanensis]
MDFLCDDKLISCDTGNVIVAGWTGRDPAAIQHHIDELAALGVAPPSTVPLYYRVSAGLLTREKEIQVVGGGSSGEVEPLIVIDGGETYLGLASDHTDRDLEVFSVALSKQACAKPVARDLWRLSEVADRLDGLELRSWIREEGASDWTLYQEGTLASIRPLAQLIEGAGLEAMAASGQAAAMLCGTLGAIGGVRPAAAFRMELTDPVLGRSIAHSYEIRSLPVVS